MHSIVPLYGRDNCASNQIYARFLPKNVGRLFSSEEIQVQLYEVEKSTQIIAGAVPSLFTTNGLARFAWLYQKVRAGRLPKDCILTSSGFLCASVHHFAKGCQLCTRMRLGL